MRFDLCVKCVLQKVSLFRETIHLFAILPFSEMFHFTCFAKNRDGKQIKHFQNGFLFASFAVLRHINQPFCQKPFLLP
jgi:hypothetical protein